VFRAGDGSVQVEDLGSTNGTFVNRTKVGAPVTLAVGDRLQIGNTVFEVKG
jgi:pSer/pThr/pTyr-binding forkhead associated (FHA) protein